MSEEVNDQVENDADEQREYTKEELEKMRRAHDTFYKGEIKRLKLEEEYHRLMADIEEHKHRKMYNMIRLAQLMAPPEGGEEEQEQPVQEQAPAPKPERKLAD
jgi:hypothetical protein